MEFSGFDGNAAQIIVTRAFPVAIRADNTTYRVMMTEGTVADALRAAGVTVENGDHVAPEQDTQLEDGMEIKTGTPFAMTFICTLGNGHMGYVPSLLSYTNGGYSTDIAYLAPGSGERLVGDYLAILNELHD